MMKSKNNEVRPLELSYVEPIDKAFGIPAAPLPKFMIARLNTVPKQHEDPYDLGLQHFESGAWCLLQRRTQPFRTPDGVKTMVFWGVLKCAERMDDYVSSYRAVQLNFIDLLHSLHDSAVEANTQFERVSKQQKPRILPMLELKRSTSSSSCCVSPTCSPRPSPLSSPFFEKDSEAPTVKRARANLS